MFAWVRPQESIDLHSVIRKPLQEGVTALYGTLKKHTATTKIVAYDFPQTFDEAQVRQWCVAHNAKYIKLEKNAAIAICESTQIVEADKEGKKYKIVVIEAGWSKNEKYYPAEVLKASTDLFASAPVMAYYDGDNFQHVQPYEEVEMHTVGKLTNVKYEKTGTREGITALFEVQDEFFRKTFHNFHLRGVGGLGFSINANGDAVPAIVGGRSGMKVTKINSVYSLDVVTNPAAGGRVERLVAGLETKHGGTLMINELFTKAKEFGVAVEESQLKGKSDSEAIALVFSELAKVMKEAAPAKDKPAEVKKEAADAKKDMEPKGGDAPKGMDAENALMQIKAMLEKLMSGYTKKEAKEAEVAAPKTPAVEAASVKEPIKETEDAEKEPAEVKALQEALQQIKIMQCEQMLESKLAKDEVLKTNEALRESIRDEFKGKVFDEKALDAYMTKQKRIVESLMNSANVTNNGGENVDVKTYSAYDRQAAFLESLLDETSAKENHPAYASLTESEKDTTLYQLYKNWGKNLQESSPSAIASTTFTVALGDTLYRLMLRDYNAYGRIWEPLVTVGSARDFRDRKYFRIGGFTGMATVSQGDSYSVLTQPSEESVALSQLKHGGIVEVTEETIRNDDVEYVRSIPRRLARHAFTDLSKAVFDVIINYDGSGGINGGTIYDSTALYTSGHGNYTTDALAYASFEQAWAKMRQQTDLSSGDPILFTQKPTLLVPVSLEGTAKEILASNEIAGATTRGNNAFQNAANIIGVAEGFLRNYSAAWFLIANKMDVQAFQVDFLDGKQEPELFIDQAANQGAAFDRDVIRYKMRHVYGVACTDYRGAYGSIITTQLS